VKGKSAIHVARVYGGRRRNFVGQNFWARGFFVSTVGRDEEVIRRYTRHQEAKDRRIDQLKLWRYQVSNSSPVGKQAVSARHKAPPSDV
jgi:putative transposase